MSDCKVCGGKKRVQLVPHTKGLTSWLDCPACTIVRCTWYQEDEDGELWASSCKHDFSINESMTPLECEFKYCPFCGKLLQEQAWEVQGND